MQVSVDDMLEMQSALVGHGSQEGGERWAAASREDDGVQKISGLHVDWISGIRHGDGLHDEDALSDEQLINTSEKGG